MVVVDKLLGLSSVDLRIDMAIRVISWSGVTTVVSTILWLVGCLSEVVLTLVVVVQVVPVVARPLHSGASLGSGTHWVEFGLAIWLVG